MFHHYLKSAVVLVSALLLSDQASAQAPLRSGQPYAEASKCSQPGVILCEDFNYPANFTCGPFGYSSGQYAWRNPGLTSYPTNGIDCQSSFLEPAANYTPQPSGSPVGGYVKKVDLAKGKSSGSTIGCIRGDCDRATHDSGPYANGSAITNDLYFRLQLYQSSDYQWPQELDNKILFLYPDKYTAKTNANVDAGLGFFSSVYCFNVNKNFSDAVAFRVGTNSCSYKTFPANPDNTGCGFNQHMEYCNGVITTTPPNDTPKFGRLFRLNKGKWYTIEFRYKLSSPGVRNGTIETWVNGVKVYSANDQETCGGYGDTEGKCNSISEIFLSSWLNPFYGDGGKGYTLIDNFIISKNYIGPPGEQVNITPPAGPTNLDIIQGTKLEMSEEEPPLIHIALRPQPGSIYYLFKNGSYYSKVTGSSYLDRWVNLSESQNYELWEYRGGKPFGSQQFRVETAS